MYTKKQTKVLVCLSGGVDSSVATALLVKQGYDVTAMFAVNYDEPKKQESCWRGDYQDALRVAAKLGIKLLRWDFQKEYKRDVLKYMYKEYSAGRTPNPDILCNKFVKFGAWLDKARALGFDYIATGHYARLSLRAKRSNPQSERLLRRSAPRNDNRVCYSLMLAKDKNKDQTYFLHQLNQEQLKLVLFPIGGYSKIQVRALAKKFALPTAQKEESMGICFIGEVSMKEFLKDKIKTKPGKIVNSKGDVLGQYDGLAFYTIGQRHAVMGTQYNCHSERVPTNVGATRNLHCHAELDSASVKDPDFRQDDSLRKSSSDPLFVIAKNTKTNELMVGTENDPLLFKKEIKVGIVHWINGQTPKFPLKCQVRLRHRQDLQSATICHSDRSKAKRRNPLELIIKFSKPQRAVTPGQFAVIYVKGECLGGGVIL